VQRTPYRCPHCDQPLMVHSDMWGPYYLCEACGWTAEDDAQLTATPAARTKVPDHVLTVAEAHRAWQTRRRSQ
jgi:hypothetical protein